ncbi:MULTISPECIES: group II intron reverse transcriptase/maturase [Planktothrix]|uniref:group II intron reverse transcriptase/maturase n=1 Tax=Planktothrix TaxID=54304 RepID=UPI0004141F7A|nr:MULTISPECIES: group II intron reverse transcriptase/maturase [Planktothrix]
MKDRVSSDIGAQRQPTNWSDIDWKTVKKRVRNLRQRIYRATENGQWNRVRSLMKLMLRSYSNLLVSVRRVTQENKGKNTPGVDGQIASTSEQRLNLVQKMQEYSLWKVRPTQRVYIPKAKGKFRPLGIPTLTDRIAQALVKNALEPSWEARFEANSYGFRPGRNCHDAIEQAWLRLHSGRDTWVLDADIKGAFDNLSHDYILKAIGQVPGRELIKQWLKAGYIEAKMFHATESGVPQGGIISPLLANIALDGLERLLSKYTKIKVYKTAKHHPPKYGFIRYADDFLVTAESQEDIIAILPVIQVFLAERGLVLNQDKTNIVSVEQGINFLGFHIRRFKNHCYSLPQKEKVKTFLQGIRDWLKANKQVKPEAVIYHLNPILRGWGNYYKTGVSKQVFNYIDHEVWKALWRWALRRHPTKGKRWVAKKYFRTLHGRDWNFTTQVLNRRGKPQALTLIWLSDVLIQRHVKVKGTSSPDNPALSDYWFHRQTRYGKTYWDKGSKLYRVATNQNWRCPVCNEHLFNGEPLHTHHSVQLKHGGTDAEENLIHLHQSCHQLLHR